MTKQEKKVLDILKYNIQTMAHDCVMLADEVFHNWTPCSKEMPEDNCLKWLWVTVQEDTKYILRPKRWVEPGEYSTSPVTGRLEFTNPFTYEPIKGNVVAWMPMREPKEYWEDEEDDESI